MATNDKPNITTDDIEKAQKYTEALNELKKAVVGVNSKFPEFADGLKEGIKAIGEKLPEVVDAMQKLNAQNKELAASGQQPKNVLKELASSFFSWNAIISVGITLLANYSDVIIDWVVALFKGKDAIEELKVKQQAMNEAFKNTGYKKAVSDIIELTSKIKLAKNGYADKKEVLKQYNETLGETLGKTNSLDIAEQNIVKHGNNYIQMMYYKGAASALLTKNTDELIEVQKEIQEKEKNSLDARKKLIEFQKNEADNISRYGASAAAKAKIRLTQIKHDADVELNIAMDKSKNLSATTARLYEDLDNQAEKFAEKFAPSDSSLNNINTIEERISKLSRRFDAKDNGSDTNNRLIILNRKLKELKDFAADDKIGAVKTIEERIAELSKMPDATKGGSETNNRLARLTRRLKEIKDFASDDKLNTITAIKKRIAELLKNPDAHKNGSETSNRLAKLNNRLAELKKSATGINYSGESHKQNIPHEKRGADLLQAQAINLTKQIELEKQNYEIDLTLLNEQLSKKLISQDEYNRQSEKLQDQFHLAIGDKVNSFRKTDFVEAQKHMQAMIDAQQHENLMAKDQQKVDKAWLPGKKFDAEKQLIEDKYAYELNLATGNAQKIKTIEEQKQKELTDLNRQYQQQRNEFALQGAQQVADKAFSIIQNNIKSQSDAKIRGLEKDKAAELGNKNLTSTQKKAIEEKYQKKETAEKVKAFKAEQKASILQAVINGALAVTKATSQTGVLAPFVIPGIIASTAIQVATIIAQKPPQYAKGGLHYQSDGRGALLPGYSRTDNTNAYLRSGEAIVVSEAMRNPWARNLVSAINVAHGGRDFSIPNTGRGYAVGGIFTDGGNANRYYNQPVNDVKELANTVAYQMINNFPPVYVDVKDINNQQNILAQTINRVNL